MNATISDGVDGEYLTDRLGDEAVNSIEKYHPDKTNKPFFLYLSTYTVHTPYQVPNETVEANKGDKYFAMIQKLDENVGKVLRKIDESNLRNNTIVIFYSDNGGLKSNSPLRGKKGDLLEGGIRVPLLVRWPTKIAAGSICHQPVTSVDFLPTFAEIVGYTSDKVHVTSGNSLVPLFSGNDKEFDNRPIFWHFPHHRNQTGWAMGAAIREGDWKLIWLFEDNKVVLYNLKDDLSESKDLSLVYEDKKHLLLTKLKEWQLKVNAEMPALNTDHSQYSKMKQ